MGHIEVSTVVPAPVDEVWALCKDIERTADWFPAIQSVRPVTEQREGVGAEYEFTARNAGRTVTYRMRVTGWDEGRMVRQEIVPESGSGLWSQLIVSMSVMWQFAAEGDGTGVRVTEELKQKGLSDLLTQPWMWWFDRRLYERAFQRLAAVIAERNT
ncbi:MAG: SRPBCC family protein [Dehalococcoidia bacterium]